MNPNPPGSNPGGSTGGGSRPGADRVPVSNDNADVEVKVSVSGTTAVMAPLTEAQLDQMTGSEETGGDIVIDLSAADGNISGVELPVQTLKELEAVSGSGESGLEIKLPTGTLVFDGEALSAITAQAEGQNVRIHLEDVGTARMNTAQKQALQGKDVRKGLDAYITVDGKIVSDFKGGSAEVEVDVPLSAGDRPEGFTVWFVAEDGSLERLNSRYDGETKTFVVSHFSDYVIIYEDRILEHFRTCRHGADCPIRAYTDISTDGWYHDGVHYCLENGLMLGYDATHFRPQGTATRAMVITMLWRLNGSPVVETVGTFTDVAEGQWYTDAVRWAKAMGITNGYSDGRFGVYDLVTREQLAVFLYQYARSTGYDVSGGNKAMILSYSDIFDVNEYAVFALQWACGNGVINGKEVGGELLLLPASSATRAQLAEMMMRLRTKATA